MSLGRHVTLKREDSASANPDKMEKIGDVIELSGLEFTADTHEDTPYSGDESDFRTYSHGLKDGGEVTITTRYKNGNTQADALEDSFFNSTAEKVQFVFPAPINRKVTMDVLVTKVGMPTGKGEKLNRDFTFKVSGEPLMESV